MLRSNSSANSTAVGHLLLLIEIRLYCPLVSCDVLKKVFLVKYNVEEFKVANPRKVVSEIEMSFVVCMHHRQVNFAMVIPSLPDRGDRQRLSYEEHESSGFTFILVVE